MKRIINLLIVVAVMMVSCSPAHRIIDDPLIETTSSNILDVTRVELTDTATIVHLEAHYLPGWWVMPLRAMCLRVDGEKYIATRIEGANFDERFWMHPEGHAPWVVTFPPIPRGAKKMDLFNGYYDIGTERLYGIDLTGRKRAPKFHKDLPRKFRQPLSNEDVKIPEISYKVGESEVRLHLLGYRDSLMDSRVGVYVQDVMMGYYDIQNVDAEGNLTLRLPLYGTSALYIGYMGSVDTAPKIDVSSITDEITYMVFVEPGEQIDVYIDLNKKGEWLRNRRHGRLTYDMGVYTSGKHAEVNRQINNIPYRIKMDPTPEYDKFIDYRMSAEEYVSHVKKVYRKCLDSINRSPDFTPLQRRVSISRLNGEYIQYILDAHNKIVRNYYAMGGRGDLYGSLPDSVKTATFTDEHNKDMVSAMQLDFENTLLLESQRLSMPILKGWLPLQEGFEILADHNANVLYTYLKIMSWDRWGSQNKKTLKLIKTRGLVDMFGEVLAQQQQRAIEIAEKVKVEPTPEGDEKAMFDAIVAPHRGKVVVIQHWYNTYSLEWTNILNMRQWAPLREEFKDDVVWINIFWTYILDIGQAELQCLKSAMLEDSVSRHYVIDATKKNPYRMMHSICDKEAVMRPDFYIVGRDGTVEPVFVPQQAATWRKEYNDGGRPTDKLRKKLREKLNK